MARAGVSFSEERCTRVVASVFIMIPLSYVNPVVFLHVTNCTNQKGHEPSSA
jgi:hypothetical protein